MEIKDVTRLPEVVGLRAPEIKPASGNPDGSFATVLKSSLAEVDRLQQQADAAITAFATGNETSVHETMIAIEQASVSFRMMMQVRNKIVEAYQEIMRMQV